MIEVDEALALVESLALPLATEELATSDSIGRILAEDIAADVDSPPHDKSLVDGWAIRVDDANSELRILEQVIASQVPTQKIVAGTASQIMTGAPIPDGTEAMVMTEHAEVDGETLRVNGPVVAGQNIMPRATSFAKGDVLLCKGKQIRSIEVGLLHEVGCTQIRCYPRPTVSVLPTGEELVDASELPGPGQIRNSNGPMLCARARQLGCDVRLIDVARDNVKQLREKILLGLRSNVLVLSGGVSMGVKDLVPPTLAELGVEKTFHKVRLKPGKPVWFGRLDDKETGARTLVFGLPGNPVSSLVCFELFVAAAIRRICGYEPRDRWTTVRLASSIETKGDRLTLHPAEIAAIDGIFQAEPLEWRGSSDMLTVTRATGWIRLEGGKNYVAGDRASAILM